MLMESQSKTGLWIGVVIVAILVLLFAFYYYYYGVATVENPPSTSTIEQSQTGDAEAAAIEKDLGQDDMSSLGTEVSDIDKELAK